jgi:NADPH2:quinone reductase
MIGTPAGRRDLLVLGPPAESGLQQSSSAKRQARGLSQPFPRRTKRGSSGGGADEAIVYPSGPFDRDGQKALAQQFKDAVGPPERTRSSIRSAAAEPALRSIGWKGATSWSASRPESPSFRST